MGDEDSSDYSGDFVDFIQTGIESGDTSGFDPSSGDESAGLNFEPSGDPSDESAGLNFPDANPDVVQGDTTIVTAQRLIDGGEDIPAYDPVQFEFMPFQEPVFYDPVSEYDPFAFSGASANVSSPRSNQGSGGSSSPRSSGGSPTPTPSNTPRTPTPTPTSGSRPFPIIPGRGSPIPIGPQPTARSIFDTAQYLPRSTTPQARSAAASKAKATASMPWLYIGAAALAGYFILRKGHA